MGDIHIQSENQSGGITAQNVNSPQSPQPPPISRGSRFALKFAWWVAVTAGIATILGVAFDVIPYFR